jgi:hypothetical protein
VGFQLLHFVAMSTSGSCVLLVHHKDKKDKHRIMQYFFEKIGSFGVCGVYC